MTTLVLLFLCAYAYSSPLPGVAPSVTITDTNADTTPPVLNHFFINSGGNRMKNGESRYFYFNGSDSQSGLVTFVLHLIDPASPLLPFLSAHTSVSGCSITNNDLFVYQRGVCNDGEFPSNRIPNYDDTYYVYISAGFIRNITFNLVVQVMDYVGNVATYDSTALANLGFPSTLTVYGSIYPAADGPPTLSLFTPNVSAITYPSLSGTWVPPMQVDMSGSDNNGINRIGWQLIGPRGGPNNLNTPPYGVVFPSSFFTTVTTEVVAKSVPTTPIPNGVYDVAGVVQDGTLAYGIYSPSQLQSMGFNTAVTVSGGSDDNIAPVCHGVPTMSVSPSADATSQSVTITLDYTNACFDASGAMGYLAFIEGPGPNPFQWQTDGNEIVLPAGTPPGTFTLIGFAAADYSGNAVFYGECRQAVQVLYQSIPGFASAVASVCGGSSGAVAVVASSGIVALLVVLLLSAF